MEKPSSRKENLQGQRYARSALNSCGIEVANGANAQSNLDTNAGLSPEYRRENASKKETSEYQSA